MDTLELFPTRTLTDAERDWVFTRPSISTDSSGQVWRVVTKSGTRYEMIVRNGTTILVREGAPVDGLAASTIVGARLSRPIVLGMTMCLLDDDGYAVVTTSPVIEAVIH